MDVRRDAFRSMGTDVSLVTAADVPASSFRTATEGVRATFAREDLRFSRFRVDSELSRLNARAGRSTRVTAEMTDVLRLAIDAADRTAGLFDPTVLLSLVAAGYDRDFDELLAGARGVLHPSQPCGRWLEVEVNGRSVRLPEGVAVDLGGIAKGWTVDRAAERALATGLPWALVNAGGDLRIVGSPPEIEIAVEDPEAPGDLAARVRVDSGALATSSVTRRAWAPGMHHLIDPRTALPAETGVLQATVWAETCAEAEVRAKWALLEGRPSLDRFPAVLVVDDGPIVTNLGKAA